MQNKANSPAGLGARPWANRAKQSQFGTSRAGTPNPRRANYAKQSQTWEGWAIWGQDVLCRRGQSCKTNPIWRVGRDSTGPIAPNKAKLGHPGVSGGRDAGRGADAPNKPNLPRSGTRGKSFMSKELWLIGHPEAFGETKPISEGVSNLTFQVSSRTGGSSAQNKANSLGLPCETNPIPGAGRDEAPGPWDTRQTCRTNPIPLVGWGSGGQNAQNEPNLRGRLAPRR
jgi:hypothetical protein